MIGGSHGCDTVAPGLASPRAGHTGDKKKMQLSRLMMLGIYGCIFAMVFIPVISRHVRQSA